MTKLTTDQRNAVSRIAALTLVNAMVFQEVLSSQERTVRSLRRSLKADDLVAELGDHWDYITSQIDYVPIFRVAGELLLSLPADADIDRALRFLAAQALNVVRQRAALRHDLMGRVYHKLLTEAKYLGTYYTSVPAATLLLKIALDRSLWQRNWHDLDEIAAFRIADLACGTGTLLMAAAETVTDNYVRSCVERGSEPQLHELHRLLMEQVIYGYDVLPSALHLTASTLALRASAVEFRETNLFNMPLGGSHHRLGSVEFLKDREVPIALDLFGALSGAEQVTGQGDVSGNVAVLPDLDLCVMNPPFTRSVGHNLLFGSVPESERKPMQKQLSQLLSKGHILASSTAGLGGVFVAAGDTALKAGGRMALVLPEALLSGVAWRPTRELFRRRYDVEFLIVSQDPAQWNFSDNTSLSEVLVLARRRGADDKTEAPPTVCVNLWRNPGTAFEALSIAQSVLHREAPSVIDGQGALEVEAGGEKCGEAVSVPWSTLRDGSWMLPCAFAQSDLIRAAYYLLRRELRLPGSVTKGPKLILLGDIATLGPDRRDIHDGFSLSAAKTAYPAFWGHDAQSCTTLAQPTNAHLSPLGKAKAGRPLRKVEDLWPKSGRLMLAERLWLNTQRVVAVLVDREALANVWWPVALREVDETAEKALVLWLNSTLGLLTVLALREETRGAWVGFKKPVLEQLPILDPRNLSGRKRKIVEDTFADLRTRELLPLPQMATDPVREQVDGAVSALIGAPDLSPLRDLLAQEPIVSLARL